MVAIDTLRSFLFVPANRPDRYAKAAAAGADAVILDLEDAVAADAKAKAREALSMDFSERPVLLRVNAVRTPWHESDIEYARSLPFAAIILPKAENAVSVARFASEVQKPVIALIESAAGLANAREIAAAEGVVQLAFGSVDFCADLGCQHQREVLLPPRFELVLASRLAGIAAPIDGVTVEVKSPETAHADAAHARALGMGGKLCIHPTQIEPVMSAFRPSESEIEWARKVIASGDGAVTVDGAMVDEPVRIRARAILTQVA
jgi:citrate lyase subunit beta/citryl-CoA lyase